MSLLLSSTLANPTTPYFALAGAGGGGVSQIVAGDASITVSSVPPGGTGVVTLSAPAEFVQGMIIIYYGETAPDGWAICDGNNGTPDLRDRFVNGAGINFPYGQPGGASTASLVIQNIPDHIHSGVPQQGSGVATSSGGGYAVSGIPGGTAGIQAAGYVSPGGSPFGIMPPYLTLTYIMKL